MKYLILFILISCTFQNPEKEDYVKNINNTFEYIFQKIEEKESIKDTSCWTTTRHMEEFAAEKKMNLETQILKVESVILLTYKVWLSSSNASSKNILSEQDIVFNHEFQETLSFKNYQQVTEGLRVVLDISFKKLLKEDLYLKPLDKGGVEKLALVADILNQRMMEYLKSKEGYQVDIEDIKEGFLELDHNLNLNEKLIRDPFISNIFSREFIRQKQIELTRENAKHKIKALRDWNDTHDNRIEKLNKRISTKKKINKKEIESLVAFIFDLTMDIPFNDEYLIELENIYNFFKEYYHIKRHVDGDVSFVLEKPVVRKMRVKNYEMDAFRDFAYHWKLIDNLYNSDYLSKSSTRKWIKYKDYGGQVPFGLTPHAAELSAEIIAEIMTILVLAYQESEYEEFDLFLKQGLKFELLDSEKNIEIPKLSSNYFNNYKDGIFQKVETSLGDDKCEISKDKYNQEQKFIGQSVNMVDYDEDGLVDVFLAGIYCNKLYKNLGDFNFKDVTEEVFWESIDQSDTKQAIFVDLNGDYLKDLILINAESHSKVFFQNKKNEFKYGFDIETKKGAHSGILFDYDNDGDLDLFVPHYQGYEEGPSLSGENGASNMFFENRDSKFYYKKVGLEKLSRWSLIANHIDYNNDGYDDIYVANDFGYDEFYINKEGKYFEEIGEEVGLADRGSCMNAEVRDYNNDGKEELYTTQIDTFTKQLNFIVPTDSDIMPLNDKIMKSTFYIPANKFYTIKNNKFKDSRIDWMENINQGWSWAARLFDFDNDGDLDLYIANGWIEGAEVDKQIDKLMINNDGYLYKVPNSVGFNVESYSRSVSVGDLNNDGMLDLVVGSYLENPLVYKNIFKAKRYLKIYLKGESPNTDAIGAKVVLKTKDGKEFMQIKRIHKGYMGQDPDELHFGINNLDIDSIEVEWPNGEKDKYPYNNQRKLKLEQ